MKKLLLSVGCFAAFSGMVVAQVISSVKSTVQVDKVLIQYELSGGHSTDYFSISLYVSRDGGKTFEGPLKEVTGDIGRDIRKGTHSIVWDALKEIPFTEESMVFDVRGERQPVKKSVYLMLTGNSTTWIGLRAGILGKVGFYAEMRANPDAFKNSDYTYKDGILTDYTPAGYYEFTGKSGYSAFSVLGGVNWQVIDNLFVYAGAGYGKENWLVQVEQFTYDGSSPYKVTYAKCDGYSNAGPEVDAGVMYRVKWFIASAGATTIRFKTFNWTVGVGISL